MSVSRIVLFVDAGIYKHFAFMFTSLDAALQRHTMRKKLQLMKRVLLLSFAIFIARADLPPLIPRDLLFGNPERTSPALPPEGKRLAWRAPNTKNVFRVGVKPAGKDDKKTTPADKKRGIRQYFWAKDNRTLL